MREARAHLTLRWALIAAIVLCLVLGVLAFEYLRTPAALYREAQSAPAWRASMLYQRLARQLPAIEEYFRLEEARREMPSVEAVATLQAIIAERPHSPVAYEAHLLLARHYAASGEATAAEDAYRAALALEDSPGLRAELAYYLAEVGDVEGAYAEFKKLLPDQPDAFTQMRRFGADPLTVAADLNAALYFSDALETLRDVQSGEAILLRAHALAGLGRYAEAVEQYQAWLRQNPDDGEAQLALADALTSAGETEQALDIYRSLDVEAARLAEADLLADAEPDTALDLYRSSNDPIGWWKAAGILEAQSRISEAIREYTRVAEAGIYLSDDAAYRMLILAQREGNRRVEGEAHELLAAQGQTYLGLKANDGKPVLPQTAPYHSGLPDDLLGKVSALEQLGLNDFALRELTLAARFDPRDEVVAAAAQALADRGKTADAYTIAVRLLTDNPRRPLSVWRLAYPKPFADAVIPAAEEAGVDPLWVWAIMRQESAFDPEALSYANAQGLLQIVPSTRDSIAEQLGQQISPDAMFQPTTNIRFGVTYLGSLAKGFDGDLELAVIAYNAGPGNVMNWLEDPRIHNRDDLYRWIGFGETREYLMRVMLDYAIYQELEALEAGG